MKRNVWPSVICAVFLIAASAEWGKKNRSGGFSVAAEPLAHFTRRGRRGWIVWDRVSDPVGGR